MTAAVGALAGVGNALDGAGQLGVLLRADGVALGSNDVELEAIGAGELLEVGGRSHGWCPFVV